MVLGSNAVNPKSKPGVFARKEYRDSAGIFKPFFFNLCEHSLSPVEGMR